MSDIAGELVAALELCEIWLVNCMPIGEILAPKPLPVLRNALARAKAAGISPENI